MPDASNENPAPKEDHAYFFSGNCQLQYLSAMFGAASNAERFFVGHRFNVNTALDGPWAENVERKEFLQNAKRVRQEGRRAILIVLKTSHNAFVNRMKKKSHFFDEQIDFPHIQFGSLWPQRRLNMELDKISDRHIVRTVDFEKHAFLENIKYCEFDQPEEFAEQYWNRNMTELRFYHPGHSNGDVFAEMLEGMAGSVRDRLPCFDALTSVLRASEGIYQNSTHTIPDRVTKLLNLSWAKTEFYQAWLGLSTGSDLGVLKAAIPRAEAVLDNPDAVSAMRWPFRSHLKAAVGTANHRVGRRDRGIAQLQEATVELKGYGPLLRKTVNFAVRGKRLDLVESTLVAAAPYLQVSNAGSEGYGACFRSVVELPGGREALDRVSQRINPGSAVHQLAQVAVAAA